MSEFRIAFRPAHPIQKNKAQVMTFTRVVSDILSKYIALK